MAEGHYDRLPTLATDLAQKELIRSRQSAASIRALAAKAAISTTPIISFSVMTRCRLDLSRAWNRPGTNATGVSLITVALSGKRLELICEL